MITKELIVMLEEAVKKNPNIADMEIMLEDGDGYVHDVSGKIEAIDCVALLRILRYE